MIAPNPGFRGGFQESELAYLFENIDVAEDRSPDAVDNMKFASGKIRPGDLRFNPLKTPSQRCSLFVESRHIFGAIKRRDRV